MKRMGIRILVLGLVLFGQVAQASWTPAKRLTWTEGSSVDVDIAADTNGHLHLVWADSTPGNLEVYYKKSTDGGATWTTSRRLTWTTGISRSPAIAADSFGGLHLVWYDNTPGNAEVYYKKSADWGATWATSQRLTWTPGNSLHPDIARDSLNNLYVVWEDQTPGNWDIYYKKGTNVGGTWAPSQRLTWTLGTSWWPALAVDSTGGLHVVWQDDTPGGIEVYYKTSADGGGAWTSAERLTWTWGQSGYPAMAVDPSGHIHVVFTIGNIDIYYKKGT
jgi:hypothetical protein